jgi:ADP-ribose pyrophosphatase YjhB (NUDIX family)
MKKYPNVAVKIIFRYKDEVAILKEKNGLFGFPGGRMEWGESIQDAINRELKEELNYSLEKEPELFDLFNYITKNRARHTVMINFICSLKTKPKFSSPEKLKIMWLTKKQLIDRKIIKERKFIDKIFNYKNNGY